MLILFTIGVLLYTLAVRTAALLGNAKAKQWVEGRKKQGLLVTIKGIWGRVKRVVNRLLKRETESVQKPTSGLSDGDWIWFHAASLGEFEQGRPVIEAIKKDYPQYKILLSFFSPSGYEIRKGYPQADEVLYLPPDTPRNASHWLQRHHFVAAFFIKYDFWFNYMQALKKAAIPLYYISLILNEKSYFFKSYGHWFSKQLANVTHFFVQDESTAQMLKSIGYENSTVCGDTRFDRVATIAKQAKPFPEIERFIGGRTCIIAGSTWPPDEELLSGFLPNLPENYCLILAPHDISEEHVGQIKAMFPEAQCYTEWLTLCQCHAEARPSVSIGRETETSNILIVNIIGILSQLYQYARFVYIGGGFGAGIHNIQEPVTFGCPVVFGPKFTSFKEAVDLVRLGGAFGVSGQTDFDEAFSRLISDESLYVTASTTCHEYLQKQLGATEIIMKKLSGSLFRS